jgi:integrase
MSGKRNHRSWGWIRRRSSGRYQASYIGPDLKRHFAPMTFELKMDAEEWLARERRGVLAALSNLPDNERNSAAFKLEWMSPSERLAAASEVSRETLAEYSARWIAQRNLKPRSRLHYEAILEKHISPKLGAIAVSNLKPAAIRTWYASTLADKPTMRSHAYGLLHAICATAVRDELLSVNPCMITGATHAKRVHDPVVPDVDEITVIADKIEPRFRALILISAWCGLRFGEVTELHRKDFRYIKDDDNPAIIAVGRGVTHRSGNDPAQRCRIDTPKSGKTRTVMIPPHIRAEVQAHLDEYIEREPDSLLFVPARGGCHVSDRVVREVFVSACKSIGREGIRLHDLRHFAGHQTARVANLPETMARLGHSTSSASLRYQGQVSGRDVEIAEALSALVKIPKP